MNVPNGHNINLPWRVQETDESATILDSTGVPVAMGLRYTSLVKVDDDGGRIYNISDYAGPIRARMIVEAVNSAAAK